MVISQEVLSGGPDGGHKNKKACYAECLDGFRPESYPELKTDYYCPRLAPENFDV
jgi:hypothetical protein